MAKSKSKTATQVKDVMVEYVVKEFERYHRHRRARFEKAKTFYEQWASNPPAPRESWQNAVSVPVMVEAEQTITPRLFTALFPTDAPIDVHVSGDAEEQQGLMIKSIIQHYFRVCDAQGEGLPALTQATLFGTGYIEGGSWLVKYGWIYNEQTETREYSLIESRPDAKFVDYFEIFPHPAKIKVSDPFPLIRRRYVGAETLKGLVDDERFESGKLKEALDSELVLSADLDYQPKKNEEYELLEYWGPWDESYKDENGEAKTRKAVPYWIMVVNRKVKIRAIPNPYNHQTAPFCKFKLFEDAKPSWDGIGIGQIGKATKDRLDKIVNQRLDNVDLVLNRQGFYNANDTNINTKKLQISKPGQWHKVSDTISSIRWMDTPDVTQSSYKEEELAKQDFREATGATAHLMPEAGSEHRTAMGIQMLQGAAGMRFRPVLRKLEIDFIQQLAMFFFSNLKQFMTTPEWVIVTGKNGEQEPIQITPQQLQAKVMFVPTGISETLNKEIQVSQLLRFKEITAKDPTINRAEINKRIAELMGFKDVSRLLTPPMQSGGAGGVLDEETKMKMKQRLAEGATPEQIKAEFMGPPPQEGMEGMPPGGMPPGEQGMPPEMAMEGMAEGMPV
jgi:hypothetical protein